MGNKPHGTLDPDKVFSIKDTLRGEILPESIWVDKMIYPIIFTKYGVIASSFLDGYIVQLLELESGR